MCARVYVFYYDLRVLWPGTEFSIEDNIGKKKRCINRVVHLILEEANVSHKPSPSNNMEWKYIVLRKFETDYKPSLSCSHNASSRKTCLAKVVKKQQDLNIE